MSTLARCHAPIRHHLAPRATVVPSPRVQVTPTCRRPHARLHCAAAAPPGSGLDGASSWHKDNLRIMRSLKHLRRNQEWMLDNTEAIRKLQEQIYFVLQSEQTLLPSTRQQWEELPPLRDSLPALQHLPAATQQDLQRAFRNSLSVTDALLNHAIRLSMAAELGPDYTRSVHAKTIRDLVAQLLLHTRQPGGHTVEEVASAAARRLLAEQVPQRLAAHLHHKFKRGKQKALLQACFPEGGPVDQAALQGLQEAISDRDLREAAARLARLLSLEDPEQQVQELMGAEDGAGIMCAVAAAFPDKFLTARPADDKPQQQEAQQQQPQQQQEPHCQEERCAELPWLLPPAELLYDMAGSVVVHKGCREADIDVGEVQLGAWLEEAVPRLVVQLGVLRWLVGVGWGIEAGSVKLVGRKARPPDDDSDEATSDGEGEGADGDGDEDGR